MRIADGKRGCDCMTNMLRQQITGRCSERILSGFVIGGEDSLDLC